MSDKPRAHSPSRAMREMEESEPPASDLAADVQELREALDDPKRYEWGEGPWEHLGDAERDVRRFHPGHRWDYHDPSTCEGCAFDAALDALVAQVDTLTRERDEAKQQWEAWQDSALAEDERRIQAELRAEAAEAALADTRRALNTIEAVAYEGTAGSLSKTEALRSIQSDCSRALAAGDKP